VDVGLALPQYDYADRGGNALAWEVVVEWAGEAEKEGLDSVWLADHLFMNIEKYGGAPGRHEGFEPIIGLAALARVTKRVKLGTLVLCCQLRPPTILAKALASIDKLSAGRLIAGVGAGWNEPEYAEAGIAFGSPGERLRQLADTLDVLRRMWTGVDGAPPCRPRPVQQPHPPLWVGGRGDRLLGLVARHADGWNTAWAWTHEAYAERLAVLDRACDALGRDPATITRTVGLYALVGEDEPDLRARFDRLVRCTPPGVLDGVSLDEWRTGRLVGTVDQVRQQLADWDGLGVTHVIAGLGAVPFAVTDVDDLHLLASAIR
jgi:alkanesulfonate monooxygenase SsuD/methylene tetrahydromethanopterin reductase-like flavin-dependent oxidoreductase (luciferase family)